MDITRVCSLVYPFIGTFKWNYIIIQLPQDWMARVKVRLSEGCRLTRVLRYASADSGKLVNWTTGAYGWLESRRSIYQTSNSVKQPYKTSTSFHCLTCICFHPGWGTFRKWPEVGHVAFCHFPGSVYSKTLDDWQFPSSSTSIIRTTCMTFAFDSRTPDGPPSCMWHSGNNRERASRHSGWPYGYWIATVFYIS